MHDVMKAITAHDLTRAQELIAAEAIPADQRQAPPAGSWSIYLFFNLLAAFDEGHSVLGVAPYSQPLHTFSYYRNGNSIEAYGRMACLETPVTFDTILANHGWIIQGNPGNYWNEHMDVCVAFSCSAEAGERILAFANYKTANTGMYNLVAYNCLTFVEEALKAGGVTLTTKSGKPLHTIVPKDAFDEVSGAKGAARLGAWKYWMGDAPAPKNGLKTIPDFADIEAKRA